MKHSRILVLLLGLICISSDSWGLDYAPKDKSFKDKNLRALEPYGPGLNEEQRPLWQEFIRMAALYEDYDITEKMLSLRDETDGVASTQYSLDLFALYKRNPVFFVKAVDRYYKGKFKVFLPVWLNGTLDITLDEIRTVVKDAPRNASMETFMKSVDSFYQEMPK